MILVLVWLKTLTPRRFFLDGFDVLLLTIFVVYFVFHFAGPWMLRTAIRRRLKQNASHLKPRRLTISPQELLCETETITSHIAWKGVQRIPMTDDHAFIYISKGEALVLPRHAFEDQRDFEAFVETARQFQEEARAAAGRFKRSEPAPKPVQQPDGYQEKAEGMQGQSEPEA
jgi:hypothetical protein